MNYKIVKVLLFVLFLTIPWVVSMGGNPTWQIHYTSSDDNIVTPNKTDAFGANIVSNTYQDGQGVITFDGPVTQIGELAFYACSSLTSLTIPNSVTSIEKEAFWKCTSLKSISIPNSVTSFGDWAFQNCSSLNSVTIPISVKSIGEGAFYACSSLTSVTIPESITSIGKGATFQKCTALKKVYWNATDCTIEPKPTGYYSPPFYNLNNIEEFVFGDNVTTIPADLCIGLSGLKSVTIPESVTSIGQGATFQACTALKKVYWNAIDCTMEKLSDGSTAPPFYNLNNIEEFVFGDNVTTITANLCYKLTGLKSVTIPESVTSIGQKAFMYCENLTSITIPKNVTNLGLGAFANCSSLTSVTIPESVTSIGEGATFQRCTALKNVYWNATDCTIERNAEGRYYSPFLDLNNIEEFVFGDKVTTIPATLCSRLTSLQSIIIPNSVTSIGENAFCGCSNLVSVTFESLTPPTINLNAFDNTNNCAIDVPCGTKATYVAALNLNNTIDESRVMENMSNPYSYSISSSNITLGSVAIIQDPNCIDPLICSADAKECCHFVRWSDGNTDNPRSIMLTQDIDLVAYFVADAESIYTRDVVAGTYGTICLPFGASDYSGATFYEVAYIGNNNTRLYLDQVTYLEAGMPYIFYAHNNQIKAINDGTTSNYALNKNGLYGTLEDITGASNFLKDKYIVYKNELRLCGNNCSLPAYRAYVELNEVTDTPPVLQPGRQRICMSLQGNNANTGLDNISEGIEEYPTRQGVYDILGRKLAEPTATGFYIINGKKVFIIK